MGYASLTVQAYPNGDDMDLRARLEQLIAERGCPQFASLTYHAKPSGARLSTEVARHTVVLGFSMENLYLRDVEMLKELIPTLGGLELDGARALLVSKEKSLRDGIGTNSAAAEAFDYLECPGLKIHRETGDLHVMGLAQSKVVLQEAEYRVVKSSPATIAKDTVRALLPSSRIRQFNLGNPTVMRIAGEVLELGEDDSFREHLLKAGLLTPAMGRNF